jgi:hypothetical protein
VRAWGAEPYKLVKNWDFGANGTIRSRADLEAEFQFHDQVDDVNVELPADMFPLTYEIDYSRVYLR